MVEGFHVPVMLLVDVAGSTGAVASAQMVSEVPKSNVGSRFGFTVTLNIAVVAQIPAVGVNV